MEQFDGFDRPLAVSRVHKGRGGRGAFIAGHPARMIEQHIRCGHAPKICDQLAERRVRQVDAFDIDDGSSEASGLE